MRGAASAHRVRCARDLYRGAYGGERDILAVSANAPHWQCPPDLRTTSTQLANSSRAVRGVDVRVCWVGQTIGVAQPGPHVERVTIRILFEPEGLVEERRRRRAPTNTVTIANCLNLIKTALLGEPTQFMLSSCLLPWPTSAVVGVVIVSSSLDGHIGLPWTAGGKVKNQDFTTEGGCATLA